MIVYQVVDVNSILDDNPIINCLINDYTMKADINNPDMPYEKIDSGVAD